MIRRFTVSLRSPLPPRWPRPDRPARLGAEQRPERPVSRVPGHTRRHRPQSDGRLEPGLHRAHEPPCQRSASTRSRPRRIPARAAINDGVQQPAAGRRLLAHAQVRRPEVDDRRRLQPGELLSRDDGLDVAVARSGERQHDRRRRLFVLAEPADCCIRSRRRREPVRQRRLRLGDADADEDDDRAGRLRVCARSTATRTTRSCAPT